MKRSPRAVAVAVLHRHFPGKISDALYRDPNFLNLEERDRRLVVEMVQGVLRHLSRLDFYIGRLSRRPLHRLDPIVRWILRTGLYQLEFLRIPNRAAVYETVSLCRFFAKSSASGLVNAVLRRFLKEPPALPAGDKAPELALRFSHPEWLVRRYLHRWGLQESLQMMELNNQPPQPAIWVNPFREPDAPLLISRLHEEGIDCLPLARLADAFLAPGSLALHPLYLEGRCFFMDAGSQEVLEGVDLGDAASLCDLCAAPGGKSFLMAARRTPGSRQVACDSSHKRLLDFRRRGQLYRVPSIHLVEADLTQTAPLERAFDFILADVPCSGLGTVRSNPEVRWRIAEADLDSHAQRQLAILENGFSILRPGGKLLYSTCSTEPEENEAVVNEFLKRIPRARRVGDWQRNFPGPRFGDCFFSVLLAAPPSGP